MASFSLPPINDNPDGGWGPSSSNLPEQFKFKDIPYAPYSKSDKLGRFADWNDLSGDNRGATVGLPNTQNQRGGGPAGGVGEMAIKRLEVELRARLRISMLKTSQAFPLSIIKRLPLVEAGLPEAEVMSRGGNTYTSRGNAERRTRWFQ
jgi:translation initiation factor 3 subunit D